MTFHNPSAELYIPDGTESQAALDRVTHLGIGAHQDDLEFMALHGIAECWGSDRLWFGGVTCCDGSGSPRGGPYAAVDDAGMTALRKREQNEAATEGRYGFMLQLDHPSLTVRDPDDPRLSEDLLALLGRVRPSVIYTHNPADKHPTHLAVLVAVIGALRALPTGKRPSRLIGCELWRDLDWMPDGEKIVMDVSGATELSDRLNACFRSQIASGKRYDLATRGRRLAHATFQDPGHADWNREIILGMDLTPLLRDDGPDLAEYVSDLIGRFRGEVRDALLPLLRRKNMS
jgi:LmbE family N-acetylglucosaminyl deacetylase